MTRARHRNALTIVDPRAMMVHLENAALADTAVVSPHWLDHLA